MRSKSTCISLNGFQDNKMDRCKISDYEEVLDIQIKRCLFHDTRLCQIRNVTSI